jgi:hypothetical protein
MRIITSVLAERHLDIIWYIVRVRVADVHMEWHVAYIGMVRRHDVSLRECFYRAQMFVFDVTSFLATMMIWTQC